MHVARWARPCHVIIELQQKNGCNHLFNLVLVVDLHKQQIDGSAGVTPTAAVPLSGSPSSSLVQHQRNRHDEVTLHQLIMCVWVQVQSGLAARVRKPILEAVEEWMKSPSSHRRTSNRPPWDTRVACTLNMNPMNGCWWDSIKRAIVANSGASLTQIHIECHALSRPTSMSRFCLVDTTARLSFILHSERSQSQSVCQRPLARISQCWRLCSIRLMHNVIWNAVPVANRVIRKHRKLRKAARVLCMWYLSDHKNHHAFRIRSCKCLARMGCTHTHTMYSPTSLHSLLPDGWFDFGVVGKQQKKIFNHNILMHQFVFLYADVVVVSL